MTPKTIRLAELHRHWQIYLFVLPAAILIGLFQYYPAASGVVHSFYRWNGADVNEYVGLENYAQLLKNSEFWHSFNVVMLLGLWNVIKMIPAVAVAVCVHRARSPRMQYLYRILFVAPMVIPGLVVVLIWRSFFFEATSGYLNRFLIASGALNVLVWLDAHLGWGGLFQPGRLPAWLGDGRLILTACVLWGVPWVGSFAVLTHLAKLQNIPRELYEAADLDGVSWWSKFTKLELPLMMGSVNILLVFVIIDTIKDAGMILALAGMQGGPGGVVTVPALFMLRKAFINQEMGAACAVGVVLTAVVMTLQKSLGALGGWERLPKALRAMLRLSALVLAFLIYRYLDSVLIPVVLVLLVIPYGLFKSAFGPLKPRPAAAPAPARLPGVRTRSRAVQSAENLFLRLSKHGFVWLVLLLAYVPLYLMLVVSPKNNTQFYQQPATPAAPFHWENWVVAWHAVEPALANSVFVTTLSTLLTLVVALAAAYFFGRVKVPGSAVLWNLLLVLMIMPTIANLVPLFKLLVSMNLANTLTALIAVGAAGGQVFAIFVLRSFVADLPQALFEAAEIDGAGHLRQMFNLVVPLSGPILGTVGVMHAVTQWNDFVLPLIVMRDRVRLPVMVALLRLAGDYVKLWGPLMAGYALASVPIIALFVMSMRLFTRGLTEGAEK